MENRNWKSKNGTTRSRWDDIHGKATKSLRFRFGSCKKQIPRFARNDNSTLLCGLFGDDAAGDASWSGAAGPAADGMNHDGSPAIAENGALIVAQSYVGSDGARMSCAISANDQSKVRNVAGGHAHAFVGV